MSNRITKRTRNTYVAAVPAVTARPAYCVTTRGTKVVYRKVTSFKNTGVQQIPGYPIIAVTAKNALGVSVIEYLLVPYVIANAPITTCYPAVAAVAGSEAAVVTDGQVGWNSGGRGIAAIDADAILEFTLPANPSGAVLCGLAPASAVIGSFSDIEHGIYFAGGTLRIYERGVLRGSLGTVTAGNPSVRITRANGVVTYSDGTVTVTSANRSTGSKRLTSALYAAGDFTDDPVIEKLFTGSSFYPLLLGNEPPSSRENRLLGGFASGVMAADAVVPVIALDGVVTVSDMSMSAVDHGLYVDYGVLDFDMSPLVRASEEFQSGVSFVMDGPDVEAEDTTDFLSATIHEGLVIGASVVFAPVLYATITERLTIGSTIEVLIGMNARLVESLVLSSSARANFILHAVLRSGLIISDYSSQSRNEAIQYATNIATGAVTRYSGFGFTNFCRVGQDLYGVRPDGLYKIDGSTDDGETLSALIDFAADDQGSPRTKRMENVFFGIATDGVAYARLTDDFGRDAKYRLIQRDSSEARINPAKGVSSRYWRLRLEIEDATYAELDNIEWVAATGARRTKR